MPHAPHPPPPHHWANPHHPSTHPRTYLHMVMASAAAVASSRREALAMGMPVRSPTIVWKLSSDSRLQAGRQAGMAHVC